jgi:N-acetylmuramoyl-L-alanine amidase
MARTEPTPKRRLSKLGELSLALWLSGCLGLSLCLPAQAGKLRLWRYDAGRSRLDIVTNASVQPRAQLIPDPTRLVIDLPGIRLGWPSSSRPGQGAIRAVRIAQFDQDTTRIVVELAPGYILDPNAVRFRGLSPTRWTVQLPPAQPIQEGSNPFGSTASNSGNPAGNTFSITPGPRGGGSITTGNLPNPGPANPNPPGVNSATGNSATGNTTSANVIGNSPRGGLFSQTPFDNGSQNGLATIDSIDLGGDELLIRSDRQLAFINRWEGNRYRITVRRAQFSPQIQQPRLVLGSAIEQIQLRQDDAQTVTIFLTPASGVRIRGARLFSSSAIANGVLVQLDRGDNPPPDNLPDVPPSSGTSVPTPPPDFPVNTETLPNPSGRRIVVIDPGHGGRDPGAIGIGGLREKDIVMEISQEVSRLLQQQGVLVQMTRNDDRELDLAPRVAVAERANADVFVSIHANAISMARPDINGLEVFYSPGRPRSARLANILHDTIVSSLNMGTRGLKVARFYVTRNTSMPSALIETGFVTGAEDAPNLANPNWRRQMARAIAQGILQYLQTQG